MAEIRAGRAAAKKSACGDHCRRWLPTVATRLGYSTSAATSMGAVLNVGGTIGSYGFAWLIGRAGFVPVLTVSFVLACASVLSIGQLFAQPALLTVVVFVAGWCVIGGQPGLNALAATFYPTYLRSTGVGWGLGVGRIGAIVGPILGGQLGISHQLSVISCQC